MNITTIGEMLKESKRGIGDGNKCDIQDFLVSLSDEDFTNYEINFDEEQKSLFWFAVFHTMDYSYCLRVARMTSSNRMVKTVEEEIDRLMIRKIDRLEFEIDLLKRGEGLYDKYLVLQHSMTE